MFYKSRPEDIYVPLLSYGDSATYYGCVLPPTLIEVPLKDTPQVLNRSFTATRATRRKYPQTVTCGVRLSWSGRQRVPRRPQGARARSSLLAALIRARARKCQDPTVSWHEVRGNLLFLLRLLLLLLLLLLLFAKIIIIFLLELICTRVFEALRMHENSWKLDLVVYAHQKSRKLQWRSVVIWAWASPAGSIAPPNAWKAIVWTKLILYSWNLVCTSRSLFQTYSSLGFISPAHPEVGHLEFCAFFMYFMHTLTNSS